MVAADLATAEGRSALCPRPPPTSRSGLAVANAAYAPIGPFLDIEPAELHRIVALNCDMPLALARHYLPAMASGGAAA